MQYRIAADINNGHMQQYNDQSIAYPTAIYLPDFMLNPYICNI